MSMIAPIDLSRSPISRGPSPLFNPETQPSSSPEKSAGSPPKVRPEISALHLRRTRGTPSEAQSLWSSYKPREYPLNTTPEQRDEIDTEVLKFVKAIDGADLENAENALKKLIEWGVNIGKIADSSDNNLFYLLQNTIRTGHNMWFIEGFAEEMYDMLEKAGVPNKSGITLDGMFDEQIIGDRISGYKLKIFPPNTTHIGKIEINNWVRILMDGIRYANFTDVIDAIEKLKGWKVNFNWITDDDNDKNIFDALMAAANSTVSYLALRDRSASPEAVKAAELIVDNIMRSILIDAKVPDRTKVAGDNVARNTLLKLRLSDYTLKGYPPLKIKRVGRIINRALQKLIDGICYRSITKITDALKVLKEWEVDIGKITNSLGKNIFYALWDVMRNGPAYAALRNSSASQEDRDAVMHDINKICNIFNSEGIPSEGEITPISLARELEIQRRLSDYMPKEFSPDITLACQARIKMNIQKLLDGLYNGNDIEVIAALGALNILGYDVSKIANSSGKNIFYAFWYVTANASAYAAAMLDSGSQEMVEEIIRKGYNIYNSLKDAKVLNTSETTLFGLSERILLRQRLSGYRLGADGYPDPCDNKEEIDRAVEELMDGLYEGKRGGIYIEEEEKFYKAMQKLSKWGVNIGKIVNSLGENLEHARKDVIDNGSVYIALRNPDASQGDVDEAELRENRIRSWIAAAVSDGVEADGVEVEGTARNVDSEAALRQRIMDYKLRPEGYPPDATDEQRAKIDVEQQNVREALIDADYERLRAALDALIELGVDPGNMINSLGKNLFYAQMEVIKSGRVYVALQDSPALLDRSAPQGDVDEAEHNAEEVHDTLTNAGIPNRGREELFPGFEYLSQ